MLNEEQLESNFGEGWRVREELFREKIEELTEAEIKANIQFNEASDLLVLVKNTRTHNDHAAFRILQRHLEELYLLKHILYERGFYLYNTTNAGQATNTPNLHVRCEAKTTKNLPEWLELMTLSVAKRQAKTRNSNASSVSCLSPSSSEIRRDAQAWFTKSSRKIYAEVNYHNDVLELYQRCIDVLEFADIESKLDSIPCQQLHDPSPLPCAGPNGLRSQLLNKLFLELGEYFLWCGDYAESAEALVRALVEEPACPPALGLLRCSLRFLPTSARLQTANALAKLPPNIPRDSEKDIISLFGQTLSDHTGPYSLHVRFRIMAWVISRLRYFDENRIHLEETRGLLRTLVSLFNDENRHVRQLARNAVSDYGDRLLRIVESSTNEIFKEYRICSAVLKERSEFFQRMLESMMIEAQPEEAIIILVDNPRIFDLAIDYLYTQNITLNEENAVEVLACANQYNFTDLLHMVEDFLCRQLQYTSLEETEHLYHLTESMVCPGLSQALRQRLRYFFEKTIINSDLENFIRMANDYPILKKQLFLTTHYLCLSMYTGNKSIAMSMLSWGVGLESRTKLKGSKGKSKIRSRSKTKEKGKAKEKGSTLEEDNEEKGQRGSCSSSHFSGDDDFLALEPPWYTHAYSSFKPLEESGRSSPSPPTSPRLQSSQHGPVLSPSSGKRNAKCAVKDSQQRDPMLGCVTIHELKKKEKNVWKGWEAPLLIAIRRGYSDIVKILIDGDVNINVLTHSGKTPLEVAVKRGRNGPGSDIVKMLVEAGGDVNRRRTKKAQDQPVFNEDMYVVHFEREKYNAIFDIKNTLRKDTTPLMVAAQYGHVQTVEWLIAGGADVNVATANMNTTLIVASAFGHFECVNKLIEAGAQVNKCNIFGWKALHFAVNGGYADVVIELFKAGARDSLAIFSTNLDNTNPKSKTAQELALEQGRMDVIQVFDIYLTKIPAYEREIKKKNAKSGS